MSRATLRIKATDPNGVTLSIEAKIDSGGVLVPDEVNHLKRVMSEKLAFMALGLPFAKFSLLDMVIK